MLHGRLRIHNAVIDFVALSSAYNPKGAESSERDTNWMHDWFLRYLKQRGRDFPACINKLTNTAEQYGLKEQSYMPGEGIFNGAQKFIEKMIQYVDETSKAQFHASVEAGSNGTKRMNEPGIKPKFKDQSVLEPE